MADAFAEPPEDDDPDEPDDDPLAEEPEDALVDPLDDEPESPPEEDDSDFAGLLAPFFAVSEPERESVR